MVNEDTYILNNIYIEYYLTYQNYYDWFGCCCNNFRFT